MNDEPRTPWLTLDQAARIVGKTRETIRLWIVRGIRIRGQRVRLKGRRNGITHQTRRRWIAEFQAECERLGNGPAPEVVSVESSDEQQGRFTREQEAVRKLLKRGAQ